MQKVEGSNPFSRFFANRLQIGTLGFVDSRDIPSSKPDRVRQRRGTGPLPTAALTPAT